MKDTFKDAKLEIDSCHNWHDREQSFFLNPEALLSGTRGSAAHRLRSHRALRYAASKARVCIGRHESARVVRRGNDRTNADRFGETPKVLLPRKVITHADSAGRFAPTKIDGARADNEDGPVISRAIPRPSGFRGYFRERSNHHRYHLRSMRQSTPSLPCSLIDFDLKLG